MLSDQSRELVELLRGRPRLGTVSGRVEYRTKSAVASAVGQRWSAQLRPFYPPGAYATISPATMGEPEPVLPAAASDVRVERVWVNAPDRSRTEGRDPDGRPYLLVVGAEAWAEYTSFRQVRGWALPRDPVSRELNPQHRETAFALLEPWRLLRGYTLRAIGAEEVAGRRGVLYRGVPTSDAQAVVASGGEDEPFVYAGAEAAEFVIDAERGVLLRWSGFASGEVYATATFTTIDFDDVLDDWLFDPSLVPGWGAAQRGAL